ncbi:FAD/NAD(P)-binding domain-containing protein [Mycena sanguinolenta]|uniref:FAD/NAD(P)-binding domain-containing protein n=1 Tax=Mycena sanguinolenta TaxID=230812 RepID=A0A8H6ZBU6_9AGAR|nr:FAD/NAD(P)-binding domain-containing protein [Mycena sanguinolenta]
MSGINPSSSSVLRVSVVGGGIGGLTAALALRRSGHDVQVFEASETKTEVGAALVVPQNALRVLDHLGISRENLKGVPFLGGVSIDPESGESTVTRWPTAGGNSTVSLCCHRGDLYEELKRLATGEGEGPPVKLRFGIKVTACDPENGTISLNNGEVIQSDLVLGADGGHNSVIRTHVVGEVQKILYSGVTLFRAVFELPASEVPELRWLTESVSGVRMAVSKEGPFRMLLMYPCRGGTLLNFVGFYDDPLQDVKDWSPKATCEDIRAKFQCFHSKFLPVLDLPVHSEILKWRLGVLPNLPTWIRGRAALLGDAAHATLPCLAQGAAMAIEDAGALGCLFPAGTRAADVPEKLEAYQDLRKERGEFVSTESVEGLKFLKSGGVNHLKYGGPLGQFQAVTLARLYEYDAIKVAQDCYEQRFGNRSPAN